MTLTLEEKTRGAEARARLEVAEKHYFDAAQPFYPSGFSITRRNPGHWDIFADQCPGKTEAHRAVNPSSYGIGDISPTPRERAFRIRGEPGEVSVSDERWDPHRPFPRGWLKFRSVQAAMLWIAEELMQEPTP